ncbi:N-acetylmuramate alpha-1-phosphate uridylyltransferase MurU [Yanghanlia caeni]|uniref:Nucleotidyltransferase family protein n=1 Tax=Yanghanlia caeni TaxID=3064283 RepID=A0ABU1D4E4_9BURK|nr:nucleotidyltransferase family protein [Alcaligenaceae bacterium LG-2]HZH55857.1 nucleotidyltransferase family protein [Burkholderiaceae bacterium]
MKAMILAAGRGERMRPLTDRLPKPLLPAGGKPLIVWHIERLVAAGFTDIVVNCAWLGHELQAALGDGSTWGAQLHWSPENPALETAGGIARALPLLGPQPFLVINGDIWSDWNPAHARMHAARLEQAGARAWLLLVDNPAHHPQGDFTLHADGRVGEADPTRPTLTFAGIGVYLPELFATVPASAPAPLAPLLRNAMARDAVLGAHHTGEWMDIGTPERLNALDARLTGRAGPAGQA